MGGKLTPTIMEIGAETLGPGFSTCPCDIPIKWSGRGNQQDLVVNTKEEAKRPERSLGRRACCSSMGVPGDREDADRRNPIYSHVWSQSYASGRCGYPNLKGTAL